VAVAYMMLSVMDAAGRGTQLDDATRERARPHAKALGEAFQLTNFLRDVREDILEFDRIYLPLSTLEQYDVSPAEIESLTFSKRFASVMEHELRRTEQLYRKGVAGIEYLPRDCQFPVLLAAVVYAEHHRLIRRRGYDVLSVRPTMSHPRRLAVAARTWLRCKRSGDPVETFGAVSAVPTEEAADADTPGLLDGDSGGLVEGEPPGLAEGDPGEVSTRRSIRRRLGDLLP
jgi:phytoene synthase